MQETILYLDNVTVSFDGFKAIDNLSLYVKTNELRCIIGPNGAGKTTMMDIITGRTRPDTGKVIFGANTDLTILTEAEIANLGIGRKFQKPTVFVNHTVTENLTLALEKQKRVFENLFFKLSAEQFEMIEKVFLNDLYTYIDVSIVSELKFINKEHNSINKQSTYRAISQFLSFYTISEDEISPDTIYRGYFRNRKSDKTNKIQN